MENNCKTEKVICGISCDAKNCVHHVNGDRCDANCISVGYTDACNCTETACKTFKAKD